MVKNLLVGEFEVLAVGQDVLLCLEDCPLFHLKGYRTPLFLWMEMLHQGHASLEGEKFEVTK